MVKGVGESAWGSLYVYRCLRVFMLYVFGVFVFQEEDGRRDIGRSRGIGEV